MKNKTVGDQELIEKTIRAIERHKMSLTHSANGLDDIISNTAILNSDKSILNALAAIDLSKSARKKWLNDLYDQTELSVPQKLYSYFDDFFVNICLNMEAHPELVAHWVKLLWKPDSFATASPISLHTIGFAENTKYIFYEELDGYGTIFSNIPDNENPWRVVTINKEAIFPVNKTDIPAEILKNLSIDSKTLNDFKVFATQHGQLKSRNWLPLCLPSDSVGSTIYAHLSFDYLQIGIPVNGSCLMRYVWDMGLDRWIEKSLHTSISENENLLNAAKRALIGNAAQDIYTQNGLISFSDKTMNISGLCERVKSLLQGSAEKIRFSGWFGSPLVAEVIQQTFKDIHVELPNPNFGCLSTWQWCLRDFLKKGS